MTDPIDDDLNRKSERPDDRSEPSRRKQTVEEQARKGDRGSEPKRTQPETRAEKPEGLIDRRMREAQGIPSGLALRKLERELRDTARQLEDPAVKAALPTALESAVAQTVVRADYPGVADVVPESIRSGQMRVAGALAQLRDHTLEMVQAQSFDAVMEIVRNPHWFMRADQVFLEDIRLTEQLLADTDIDRIVNAAKLPSMTMLLADLDKVGNLARHVFETHSATIDQVIASVDSLPQSQLDALVRSAVEQLWDDVNRRGWVTDPIQSSETPPEVAQELAPEIERAFAEAPSDRAAAFKRLARSPIIWQCLLAAIGTYVALAIHRDASESLADAHREAMKAQSDLLEVQNRMLKVLDEYRDAQVEMVNLLREHRAQTADEADAPDAKDESDIADCKPPKSHPPR